MFKKENNIEMKGKESELREYFKSIDKTKKPFIVLENHQKIIVIVIIVSVICAFFVILWGEFYLKDINKDYLTVAECNQRMNQAMNDMQIPWYDRLFQFSIPIIPFILVSLGIGWILHGVGFKFIG